SGHLTLDGNTVAGTLSAQNGTFTVTNNNVAVGSLAGNGQGVLNGQLSVTNGHDTFGGDLSGAGTVQIDGGKQTFSGGNDYTGATTVARGTLALAQNGSIQKSAGVHVASDGSFDISGLGTGTTAVQALDGTGSVALGSKTLQLSNANAPFGNVYSGVMSGAGGSLSITGGQEVLTGANTYTGTTSIASGAGLQLTGSLQSAVSNAGTFDVNGGRVAGQTVNDGSHALMTAENNAHLSDIVNNQGVVKLVNAYAQHVTNATGAQFSATSGQLAGLTNAGEALLTARNTVTGDVSNSGHLTLDGNTVAGTLSA
ncbi:hypothetical protein GS535_04325, partial [Saccharibacter sp. EH611]|uniref:autotransporter-associated beta strand repeat-containing protein n=1 Tax=Saccharibacter sp. EH611 TaxID=2689391 RepID=UPI001320BAB9|nr:hypothetical protein [Saccharibacter sp. EH611]